ncbi:MAG: helix-turn-helix domain-containing protein [Hyphomicrobiales bacterium]
MGNNLRKLRLERGWTHDKAAAAMCISRGQFIKLERGERKLTERTIALAAKAFGVSEADVITERRSVPLVGYVGAGATAHHYEQGQGPFDDVPAVAGSNDQTVAVEIRGDSLGALFDRGLIYYDDVRRPVTTDLIGKLCVVGLPDGRILVKKITRSKSGPSLYHLSGQYGDPILDTTIEWAARVKSIVPR